MFKNQPIDEKGIETIIGHSVKVKGNFQTDGGMQIDGEMEGSLKIGTDLIIGENAKITANTQANRIMISGKIKGNIKANESLEITETAKIDGDIETKVLSTEPGSQINGSIKMSEISEKEKIEIKENAQEDEENNHKK